MANPLAPTAKDLEEAYRTRDPLRAGHQLARGVVVDSRGITVLCTANPKGEGDHTWLMQLDDSGKLLWEHHYPLAQGAGSAIAPLADGGFVIAGDLQRSPMALQGILTRLHADGSVSAVRAFGTPGITGFSAVLPLRDGSILAAGSADWKGWIVRTDGDLSHERQLRIEEVESIYGLAPAGHGFAIAASDEEPTLGFGIGRLVAFADGGSPLWHRPLPAQGRGQPSALIPLPDGGYVAVGNGGKDDKDKNHAWVTRTDGKGDLVWEKFFGGSDENSSANAVALLDQGRLAVVGSAEGSGPRALRVLLLNGDGSLVWQRSYGGKDYDLASGVARAAHGGMVVVGMTSSGGAGKTNAWILRLDGKGDVVWQRIFGSAAQ